MINIDQLLVKFAEARYKIAAPPTLQNIPPMTERQILDQAPNFIDPSTKKLVSKSNLPGTSFVPRDREFYDTASPFLDAESPTGISRNYDLMQGMGNPLNPTQPGFYALPGEDVRGFGAGPALASGAAVYGGIKGIQNRALMNPANYVGGGGMGWRDTALASLLMPRNLGQLHPQIAQNFLKKYMGGEVQGISVSNPGKPFFAEANRVADASQDGPITSDPAARAAALMAAAKQKPAVKAKAAVKATKTSPGSAAVKASPALPAVPLPGNAVPLGSEKGSIISRRATSGTEGPNALAKLFNSPNSVKLPPNQANMAGVKGWYRSMAPAILGGVPRPSYGPGRYAPIVGAALGAGIPLATNYFRDITETGDDPNEQGGWASLGLNHPQERIATKKVNVPTTP